MRDFLIALLESTLGRARVPISHLCESIRESTDLIQRNIEVCEKRGLLRRVSDWVEIDSEQRLMLAIEALKAHADVGRVCRKLDWREFEELTLKALEANSFSVTKHLVFKHNGHRYEIDLVGSKEPLLLCADCKHWNSGLGRMRIQTAARRQFERIRSLADEIPNLANRLRVAAWRRAVILPTVITLSDTTRGLHEGIPIVPILRLRSFLNELNPLDRELATIVVDLRKLNNHSSLPLGAFLPDAKAN